MCKKKILRGNTFFFVFIVFFVRKIFDATMQIVAVLLSFFYFEKLFSGKQLNLTYIRLQILQSKYAKRHQRQEEVQRY
jgi:hypothetical protein